MAIIKAENLNLKLQRKVDLNKNVYQFIFNKSKAFDFVAGQYLDMFLDINGRKDYRSFSISSSPTENEIILTIKNTRSIFKEKLFDLQINDSVHFYGPLGGFTFNENNKSVVLISAGLGITPFRSMIKFNYDKNLDTQLRLFAFFSHKEDFIFYDELKKISEKSKNLKLTYSLTSKIKNGWDGEIGRISKKMLTKYLNNIPNLSYMIAGPTEMVDDTQGLLKEMRISSSNIRIEYYPGYSD